MGDPKVTLELTRDLLVALCNGVGSTNLQLESLSESHPQKHEDRTERINGLLQIVEMAGRNLDTVETQLIEANGELLPTLEKLGNYIESEQAIIAQEAIANSELLEQFMETHHADLLTQEQAGHALREDVATSIARFEEVSQEQLEAQQELEQSLGNITDQLVNSHTHLDEIVKAEEAGKDALLEHLENYIEAVEDAAGSFAAHLEEESNVALTNAREDAHKRVLDAYEMFRESVLATLTEINSDMEHHIDETLEQIDEISGKLEDAFDEAWHELLQDALTDIGGSILSNVGGFLIDKAETLVTDYATAVAARMFPVPMAVYTFLTEADEFYSGYESIKDILETMAE